MQLINKKPSDDKDDISIDCFFVIKSFSNRFFICFERPFGATSLFFRNHDFSIEILIIKMLHANNGHMKGPPADINSFISLSLFVHQKVCVLY